MTDVELRDELMTLLVAGHETTGTALAWAFDLLLHNPGALERLRAEIESRRGGRVPRRGDQGDAADPAGRAGRVAQADAGPGARRLRAAGRDARVARTSGSRTTARTSIRSRSASGPSASSDGAADTYSWIPFGGGIRRCLGASFALFEMKTVIPAILQPGAALPGLRAARSGSAGARSRSRPSTRRR